MTVLTDEEQAFAGTVGITGMSTHRARLARIVGVYLDGHASVQERLVGNHALQLSKRPFGVSRIGLALLAGRLFATLATGSLSDVGQILHSNQCVGVPGHDAFGDHMIGVLLQPSLSPAGRHQTTGSRTSAFLLQTLSQSRVVVGFGDDSLASMKGTIPLRGRGHSQVAHTHVHTNHARVCCWGWGSDADFQGNQQIETLLRFVVPQRSRPNFRILLDESDMLLVARVRQDHTALKCQDADLVLRLETVVLFVLVSQGGRNIVDWLIQSLIALVRLTCFALSGVLLHFGPQAFVGRSHLAGNTTSHLGG